MHEMLEGSDIIADMSMYQDHFCRICSIGLDFSIEEATRI